MEQVIQEQGRNHNVIDELALKVTHYHFSPIFLAIQINPKTKWMGLHKAVNTGVE